MYSRQLNITGTLVEFYGNIGFYVSWWPLNWPLLFCRLIRRLPEVLKGREVELLTYRVRYED
jgi:hypothetical protein